MQIDLTMNHSFSRSTSSGDSNDDMERRRRGDSLPMRENPALDGPDLDMVKSNCNDKLWGDDPPQKQNSSSKSKKLVLDKDKKMKNKKKASTSTDEEEDDSTIDDEIARLEAQLRELKQAREQQETEEEDDQSSDDDEDVDDDGDDDSKEEQEQVSSATPDTNDSATKTTSRSPYNPLSPSQSKRMVMKPVSPRKSSSEVAQRPLFQSDSAPKSPSTSRRREAESAWNRAKPVARFEMSDMRPTDFMGGGSWNKAPGFKPLISDKRRPSYRRRQEETDMALVSLVDRSSQSKSKPVSKPLFSETKNEKIAPKEELVKQEKPKQPQQEPTKNRSSRSLASSKTDGELDVKDLEAQEKPSESALEDSFDLCKANASGYYSFPGTSDGEMVINMNRNLVNSVSSISSAPSPHVSKIESPRMAVTPSKSFDQKRSQTPSSAPSNPSTLRRSRRRDSGKIAPPPLTSASSTEGSLDTRSKSSSSESGERKLSRATSTGAKKPKKSTRIKATKNDLKKLNFFLAQQEAERGDLNTVETAAAHIMDDTSADGSAKKVTRGGKKPNCIEDGVDSSKPAWARKSLRSTDKGKMIKDGKGDLAKPISAARMPVRRGDN